MDRFRKLELPDLMRADLQEISDTLKKIKPNQCPHLGHLLDNAGRVFVIGQGRSGLVLRMFAMRLTQLGIETHIVGEATTPAIQRGDLLLAVSGSGETEGVVSVASKARSLGAALAVITACGESSLACMANQVTVVPGHSPKIEKDSASCLPLASVLEQSFLLFLDCVVGWLAQEREQSNDMMMARHANLE